MSRVLSTTVGRRAGALAVPLAAALALVACGSGSSSNTASSSGSSGNMVSTGKVNGATVLVDSNGRTLYALSAERGGKFICTGSCTKAWHPLAAGSGTPTGSVGSLAVVKRPDGTKQVTYRGMPLYTFASDTAAGQARGQGFKDVGTWSDVATSGGSAKPAPAAPATNTNSGGYGGY